MYYTFESNKIYPVIKAGKKYFKNLDHFAPVSPNAEVGKGVSNTVLKFDKQMRDQYTVRPRMHSYFISFALKKVTSGAYL